MNATGIDDRTYDEVNRLFDRFRIANLNVKYYGCRAEFFEVRERSYQIASATLSALALLILLLNGDSWARYSGAVLAGLATLLTAIQPFLGWKEKTREMNFLHRAHHQVCTRMESLLTRIRRAGIITDELAGASAEVICSLERLQALDEALPDDVLKDKLNAGVQTMFPPDFVWTNF